MTSQSDPKESAMLAAVRKWRKDAYEARQQVDSRQQARETQDLLNRFGLKLSDAPDDRRRSAA